MGHLWNFRASKQGQIKNVFVCPWTFLKYRVYSFDDSNPVPLLKACFQGEHDRRATEILFSKVSSMTKHILGVVRRNGSITEVIKGLLSQF